MRQAAQALAKAIEDALGRMRVRPSQIAGQLSGDQVAPAASGSRGTVDRDDLITISSATPQPLGTAAAGTVGAASDAGHIHAMPTAANVGAEPALGNPGTDGYVLSSTALGVRSWVAQSGGGGGGSLTIEEADGSPSVSGATKLILPNGTLSASGTEVTYTPVGGGGLLAAVRANGPGTQAYTNGSTATIEFTSETLDQGGYYNTSTYRWTPPAGVVQISVVIQISSLNIGVLDLRKNGASLFADVRRSGGFDSGAMFVPCIVDLADGDDYYDVIFTNFGSGGTIVSAIFSGLAFPGTLP